MAIELFVDYFPQSRYTPNFGTIRLMGTLRSGIKSASLEMSKTSSFMMIMIFLYVRLDSETHDNPRMHRKYRYKHSFFLVPKCLNFENIDFIKF